MPAFKVEDIKVGTGDASGTPVTLVYTKNEPYYAVYAAGDRVNIQYADDLAAAQTQRAALVTLNPDRGEINGLVDGWRESSRADEQARADRYDRRVADALIVACEGDVPSAQVLLDQIKADVTAQRTSHARYDYLMWALGSAFTVLAVAYLVLQGAQALFDKAYPIAIESIVYATAAGALGALFSIAIAMRTRTVLTDLHTFDNRADAFLRMLIGITAGPILVCILIANFTSFSLGGQSFSLAISQCEDAAKVVACANAQEPLAWWMRLLVIGFVAGFSERFVPDLLAKAATGNGPASSAPKAADQPVQPVAPAGQAVVPAAQPNGEDEADACLSAAPVTDSEATADAALPAAEGG